MFTHFVRSISDVLICDALDEDVRFLGCFATSEQIRTYHLRRFRSVNDVLICDALDENSVKLKVQSVKLKF